MIECITRDVLYEAGYQHRLKNKKNVQSLTNFCLKTLVDDSKTARLATQNCPLTLTNMMLQVALVEEKEIAVDEIISNWPSSSLVLNEVLTSPFQFTEVLYQRDTRWNSSRGLNKAAKLILYSFFKGIKKGIFEKLRELDLSGICLGKVAVEIQISEIAAKFKYSKNSLL